MTTLEGPPERPETGEPEESEELPEITNPFQKKWPGATVKRNEAGEIEIVLPPDQDTPDPTQP